MLLNETVSLQKEFFRKGKTLSISDRIEVLKSIEEAVLRHEDDLYEAFSIDLSKGKAEAYMAEISMILQENRALRKNLKKWARPKNVKKTLGTWPAKSTIYMEPYGVVLVLAPWNYPMLLSLSPLMGAIAAGNCVVLKCSKSSPNCAKVLRMIVDESCPKELAYCVDENLSYDEVLNQDYQYIFFTGSPKVGRQIMERASKDLIPVSLELGGKSPCFVTESANLKKAARRIVWGKLLNAGQTCITVDYIIVSKNVKYQLIELIEEEIKLAYPDTVNNPEYPRIISNHHFERLCNLIEKEREVQPVIGGKLNVKERKIGPVILPQTTFDNEVMKEEIFGPIIPVIEYDNLDDMIEKVNDRPHPLACYVFTEDKKEARDIIKRVPFGGGCINDTILHIANHHMPFGGVGNSGMGGYHGWYSFETFSHRKSIVQNTTRFDIPIRFGPYNDKKWEFVKKVL